MKKSLYLNPMDNQLPETTKQQMDEARNEQLARGLSFLGMSQSEGWKLVLAYYQNQVQALATELLVSDKTIEEYEAKRQQIKGIRNLIGYINNDVETYRQSQDGRSAGE